MNGGRFRDGGIKDPKLRRCERPDASGSLVAAALTLRQKGLLALSLLINEIPMSDSELPFFSRVWLAWVVWFRIVFDGLFAARVKRISEGEALPAAPEPKQLEAPKPSLPEPPPAAPALQLLALLQREGRLVDFLEQDVTGFSDADVGAAARVVHQGCRKALRAHAKLTTVRTEEEGASVTLQSGFDPAEIKLIGNVQGSAPYRGKLVHRGWRAASFTLPAAVEQHD